MGSRKIDMTELANDVYLDLFEIEYEKYSNGESTQSEFFEAVRPIMDIVLSNYQ